MVDDDMHRYISKTVERLRERIMNIFDLYILRADVIKKGEMLSSKKLNEEYEREIDVEIFKKLRELRKVLIKI